MSAGDLFQRSATIYRRRALAARAVGNQSVQPLIPNTDPHGNCRKHPRIPLLTPVDVRGPKRFLASSSNVSLGGMLAVTDDTFAPDTQLWVRFNLPSGQTVSTQAVVVHSAPGKAMGMRFVGLPETAVAAIEQFAARVINHTRRGLRVPRRTHVMLRHTVED